MKYIKLFEKFTTAELTPKKNIWYDLTMDMIKDVDNEIFDMIQIAYKPIGGHLKFKNLEDIKNIKYAEISDIDSDPDADIIFFGKSTQFGIKRSGVGHDGSKAAKRFYLSQMIERMQPGGKAEYSEVSGKLAEIVLSNGVNTITDEETIKQILKGKDIKYLGKIKDLPGDGWYSRKIGGKTVKKIMVGNIKK